MVSAVLEQQLSTDGSMAKKKATQHAESNIPSRQSPRMMGIQTLEVQALRDLISECQFELSEIEAILDRAEKADIKAIEMNGATKLERGRDLLRLFASNIYSGLKNTMSKKSR